MPRAVLYVRNSLEKLGEQSSKLGKKAFIVSDAIMEKLGYIESCVKQLHAKGSEAVTYKNVLMLNRQIFMFWKRYLFVKRKNVILL